MVTLNFKIKFSQTKYSSTILNIIIIIIIIIIIEEHDIFYGTNSKCLN